MTSDRDKWSGGNAVGASLLTDRETCHTRAGARITNVVSESFLSRIQKATKADADDSWTASVSTAYL